jgi:hypothetical protein
MTQFTQDDLVQYLYNDASDQKMAAIKAALENDWDLRKCYERLSAGKNNLDQVILSPRVEVLNRILQHASSKQAQLYPH